MFGLMRAKKCGMSEAEKDFRRLNYCGTCKTTGALYGQKARFLLNHDAVFLAEILSALSGENVKDWEKSYQSFNCLKLPENEMPKSLQFAATTSVILLEFKLADHVADEKKKRYRWARKAFSEEFQKAEKLLKSRNFPLDEIRDILQTQEARESANGGKNAADFLSDLAAPTAATTAIFFSEGAKQIGKSELQNSAYALGFAFGKLIYLLDAFEDYERDFRANQFNALRAAFNLEDDRISPAAKRQTVSILRGLETEIGEKINELPIAENQKPLFISRLAGNLQRKLETDLPVVKTKKVCAPKPRRTFKRRWRNASEKARVLARHYSWQMPLVFLFVFAFALLAPARIGEAKSARECFDLSFNLMFLGTIFGAVAAFPKTILMQSPIAEKDEKKRKRKNFSTVENNDNKRRRKDRDGWCDACHCDCGDCGDCCRCGHCCDDCCPCDGH